MILHAYMCECGERFYLQQCYDPYCPQCGGEDAACIGPVEVSFPLIVSA